MAKSSTVHRGPFKTQLRRIRGKGGWTYVTIPKKIAPPITRAWARTPVRASIDGVEWDTSIWRAKTGEGFLPDPQTHSRQQGRRARRWPSPFPSKTTHDEPG